MPYVEPVQDSTTIASMSFAEQVKEKILALQEALQKNFPNYEHLLHLIHSGLAKNPDTVHFLSDKEIGIIVAGLSKKTGVVLAEKLKKKAEGKLKGTTLADL